MKSMEHVVFAVLIALVSFAAQAQPSAHVVEAIEKHFNNPQSAEMTPAALASEARFNSHFNMMRELSKAVDRHEPLDNLEKYGIKVVRPGAIEVDQVNHPEWIGLHSRLVPLGNTPGIIDYYKEELLYKGFRESDLETLRTFVENTDLSEDTILPKALPLAKALEKKVQANQAAGLDNTDVIEQFLWRTAKLNGLRYQKWSVDLLKNFDKQRQRILISIISNPTNPMVIGANSPDANKKFETSVASGKYVAAIEKRIATGSDE